jgi:hypothetical protein
MIERGAGTIKYRDHYGTGRGRNLDRSPVIRRFTTIGKVIMRHKKRGIGWYFGMTFGDPIFLSDPDAPGLPPGGKPWHFALMWGVLGLIFGALVFIVWCSIYLFGQ